MCIIIDTNTLDSVFDKTNSSHAQFRPVLDWIIDGNGKVVFGGTKYIKEIGPRLIPLFLALKTANKAIKVDSTIVDVEEMRVSSLIQHGNFDDQHIVALLIKSGCKLICSLDVRAYPYFQHSLFFSAKKKPKIYSGLRNAKLLSKNNVGCLCMPCVILSQKAKLVLGVI